MKLCDKIDSSSNTNGKACVLSMYINRFVADVYLPLIEQNILDKLRAASKGGPNIISLMPNFAVRGDFYIYDNMLTGYRRHHEISAT